MKLRLVLVRNGCECEIVVGGVEIDWIVGG